MDAFLEKLAEAGAQAVLEAILMGALGAGAALFARNWARRGKVWIGDGTGRTCNSAFVLLVGVLCAAMAAACLILGLLDPQSLEEQGALIAWAGLVGGFTLGFLAMAVYARHTWEWGPDGLSWRGVWRQVAMPWSAIARVGRSWDGQFYAADKAGRKIRWSTLTLEHEELARAIAAARPDLYVTKR
jgi:hypothetical protein